MNTKQPHYFEIPSSERTDTTDYSDLSDSEKEEVSDDEIEKYIRCLNKKLKNTSALHKNISTYTASRGQGKQRNDLSVAILDYLFGLYLSQNVEFYSVKHVFDSQTDFLERVAEYSNYRGAINEDAYQKAKGNLKPYRCLKIESKAAKDKERFGTSKKFIVQMKKLKNFNVK
jgi:hypothetical protein